MKSEQYYQMVHNKELKTLAEVVSRIKNGFFWLTSVRLDKELVGGGYRLTVYLRERK